jgi:hypothetical protein
MQHLQYMARFLMLETKTGYADIGNKKMVEFINNEERDDGIGNLDYEKRPTAQNVIRTLNIFYNIFKDDPMLDSKNGIKEFSVEYFVISIYLLIRHLGKYYVIDDKAKEIIKNFVYDFHKKWREFASKLDNSNGDLLNFCNRRQQGENDVEIRDIILRQMFFQYVADNNENMIEKDTQRNFSELQRIIIYRRDKGLCQQCLKEGRSENEAKVSWSNYQADHIFPHSKGGKTTIDNGMLLCTRHNLLKSDKVDK